MTVAMILPVEDWMNDRRWRALHESGSSCAEIARVRGRSAHCEEVPVHGSSRHCSPTNDALRRQAFSMSSLSEE